MLELIYSHVSLQSLMWLVALFPLAGAAVPGLFALASARSEGQRFAAAGSSLSCFFAALSWLACIVLFFTLQGFEAGSHAAISGPLFRWAALPGLFVDVGLRMDELSLLVSLVLSSIGFLVHLYSLGFMKGEEGVLRYFSLLSLLLFFMQLLVLADNMILLLVGWEGVGISSWLLISFWFGDRANARAGLKAFVLNAIGDGGILIGMFLIFGVMSAAGAHPESGLFNFETMQQHAAYFVPMAGAISIALLVGAAAKSAQIPLSLWLPDATAAPIPALALIHSATTVAAGVYVVVRLGFIFAMSPTALEIMAVLGAASALLGAVLGLAETDLRKILAYSTISQQGSIFLAAGVGAFGAATFHLTVHASFKALLFLAAGNAIQALGGESDIRRMGGLKMRMPISAWSFVVGSAALAGIAPLAGFFSMEGILWQVFERGHGLLWAAAFLGVGLTAFYVFRAAASVFFGQPNFSIERFKRTAEPSMSMVVPAMLLVSAVVLGGIVGVPTCFGGSNHIGTWLSALIPAEMSRAPGAHSCGTQIVLAVVTLLWSMHFSVLGWLIYAQKRDWPERIARRLGVLAKLVSNGFYVDRVCERLIVKPLLWFSRRIVSQGVDAVLIDGIAVEGSSRAVGLFSSLVVSAQTGVLQNYLLYFLIGVVLIVGLIAL